MSDLKGFQKQARMFGSGFGVSEEVATRLPFDWPGLGSLAEVLFEAGITDPENLHALEERLRLRHPGEQKEEAVADDPKNLMRSVNGSRRHDIPTLQKLVQATSGWPIFIPGEGDAALDVEASLDALQYHFKTGGPPERIRGHVPKTLWEVLAEVEPANPLTGAILPELDSWHEVGEGMRLFTAYLAVHPNQPLRNMPEHMVRAEAKRNDLVGTVFEDYVKEFNAAKEDPTNSVMQKARGQAFAKPRWASAVASSVPFGDGDSTVAWLRIVLKSVFTLSQLHTMVANSEEFEVVYNRGRDKSKDEFIEFLLQFSSRNNLLPDLVVLVEDTTGIDAKAKSAFNQTGQVVGRQFNVTGNYIATAHGKGSVATVNINKKI